MIPDLPSTLIPKLHVFMQNDANRERCHPIFFDFEPVITRYPWKQVCARILSAGRNVPWEGSSIESWTIWVKRWPVLSLPLTLWKFWNNGNFVYACKQQYWNLANDTFCEPSVKVLICEIVLWSNSTCSKSQDLKLPQTLTTWLYYPAYAIAFKGDMDIRIIQKTFTFCPSWDKNLHVACLKKLYCYLYQYRPCRLRSLILL